MFIYDKTRYPSMPLLKTVPFLFLFISLSALAQEGSDQQGLGQEDMEYAPNLQPGLHVVDNINNKSQLAAVARRGGSIVISEGTEEEEIPTEPMVNVYTIKAGDTLWDICSRFFGDPYVWPRIWSYNSKITNPNWIYPGDSIWLSEPVITAGMTGSSEGEGAVTPSSESLSQILTSKVLLNRGFVDKKTLEQSGTLMGAHKEVTLLGQFDEAYVVFEENKNVKPRDKFAAFVILKTVKSKGKEIGKLVEILGQVTVTSFNKDTRVARVLIDESTRTIERGTFIGPIQRTLEIAPVATNDRDLEATLIAILDPVKYAASHQLVFIDRGKDHGVKEGNRFFAVEKRDNLRKIDDERDDADYPEEVLAEIQVVETRSKTSTCLITSAVTELAVGQKLKMRKGY